MARVSMSSVGLVPAYAEAKTNCCDELTCHVTINATILGASPVAAMNTNVAAITIRMRIGSRWAAAFLSSN